LIDMDSLLYPLIYTNQKKIREDSWRFADKSLQ